jgi:ribonuclease HII
MQLPNLKVELEILRAGEAGSFVMGVDEAGRGPLAGPVVAAAAWLNPEFLQEELPNLPEVKLIRDSKSLSAKQREEAFKFLVGSEYFQLGLGEVSAALIDQTNILRASLQAMRLAVEELREKLRHSKNPKSGVDYKAVSVKWEPFKEEILLIDGKQKIPQVSSRQLFYERGDARVISIAAASICAKVTRDLKMRTYHEQFPHYGFDRHKGYGTKAHLEALKQYGTCEIHRKSFGPVKGVLEKF